MPSTGRSVLGEPGEAGIGDLVQVVEMIRELAGRDGQVWPVRCGEAIAGQGKDHPDPGGLMPSLLPALDSVSWRLKVPCLRWLTQCGTRTQHLGTDEKPFHSPESPSFRSSRPHLSSSCFNYEPVKLRRIMKRDLITK